jgi:hypothetical protein
MPCQSFDVWDTQTGEQTLSIPNPVGHGQGLAFSPDGRTLALCLASRGSTLVLFGLEPGGQ